MEPCGRCRTNTAAPAPVCSIASIIVAGGPNLTEQTIAHGQAGRLPLVDANRGDGGRAGGPGDAYWWTDRPSRPGRRQGRERGRRKFCRHAWTTVRVGQKEELASEPAACVLVAPAIDHVDGAPKRQRDGRQNLVETGDENSRCRHGRIPDGNLGDRCSICEPIMGARSAWPRTPSTMRWPVRRARHGRDTRHATSRR